MRLEENVKTRKSERSEEFLKAFVPLPLRGLALDGALSGLLFLLLAAILFASPVLAGAGHHVGLVVRFGDGSVYTECVSFEEDSITGADVLQRSALSVVTQAGPMGAAVCKIDRDGCNYPAEHCFCQCEGGGECLYWAYYHLKGDRWEYSQIGASSYRVHDGDVEGWAWGSGTMGSNGAQPPVRTFGEICATPTPFPTITPSPTVRPTDTPTLPPTATPVPVPSFTPTFVPFSVSFSAMPERIDSGGCATLRWDVEGVRAVYLDGAPVTGHEERQVCPRRKTTYTLQMDLPDGSRETRRVTVDVFVPTATRAPMVSSPAKPRRKATVTLSPTVVPSPMPTPTSAPSAVVPTPAAVPSPTFTPMATAASASPVPLPTAPRPTPVLPGTGDGLPGGNRLLAYGSFALLAGVLLALLGVRGAGGRG